MRKILIIACVMTLVGILAGGTCIAGVPDSISYQGKLTDASGQPVSDGTYPVQFKLYAAGTLFWTSTPPQNVATSGGVFTTQLSPLAASDLAGKTDVWMEIWVGSPLVALSPRTKFTSVPYALISGDSWSLLGNAGTTPGTDFIGTTDNQPLEFRVNNARGFRLEPTSGAPNVIGGHPGNAVNAGTYGATISGGGSADLPNRVTSSYGAVGGGYGNTASGFWATVAGGAGNTASGYCTTVSGGIGNTASGSNAAVAGGYANTAIGGYSFAAGRQAKANHQGAFVWADSTAADFASTAADQFLIRASGGVGIGANDPQAALDVNGLIRSRTGGVKFPDGTVQTTATPASLPPSGAAGGDLTGTYPAPVIADGAVTSSKLAAGALSSYTGNIQNLAGSSANPVVVGSVQTYSNQCIAVSGRYAYVANGVNAMQVIDLSNPGSPAVVGSVSIGISTFPSAVAVSGRYAYVGTSSNPSSLRVIDISNPASPALIGTVGTNVHLNCVAVSGRYAFVVSGSANSLQVIDVANPASPAVVDAAGTGSVPYSVAVSGTHAYVANGASQTMQVFDISNPTMTTLVGSVGTGGAAHSVAVSGRYAYVVTEDPNTLQVIDVSNSASPAVVGSVGTGTDPRSVAVSGRYVYVANYGSNTLQVIDVSNPASPAVVGSVGTGSQPYSVAVSGRYVYVANYGASTMQVIDISGIETTSLVAHSLEAGTLQVRGSAVVANLLSVGGGLNVGGSGNFAGTVSANGVALTSDLRFKSNIRGISNSLESVMKLRGVSFDWKRDEFKDRNFGDRREIGLIAQEVEKVFPELVSTDSQGYRSVAYQNLVPVLIEAVKEQQSQMDAKDARIDDLEARLKRLESLANEKEKP